MFLVFTKPGARKVQNIRSNPAVMLAPGDPAADFGVLLVRGLAEVVDLPTRDLVPAPFFHAYADRMADIGLSRDEFLATHSLAIRIRPTRYLGRAGRSHLNERRLQIPSAEWAGRGHIESIARWSAEAMPGPACLVRPSESPPGAPPELGHSSVG
jgi:hypothetical protein